jgi:hypothetical protein
MPITTKKPKRKKGDLGKLAKNIGTVAVVGGGAAFATGAAVGGGITVAKGAVKVGVGATKAAYTAGKTAFGATKIPGMISDFKAKKAAGKQAVKDLNKAAKNAPKRLPASTSATGPKTKTTSQIKKEKSFKKKVYGQPKNKPLKLTTQPGQKGGQQVISSRTLPDPKTGSAGRKFKATQKKARALYDKASPNVKPKIAKKYKAELQNQRVKAAVKQGGKKLLLKAGAKRAVAFIPGVGLPLAGAMTVYDVAKFANKKRKKK